MFAVRGWSVPPGILKRESSSQKKGSSEAQTEDETTKPESSRKRKRKGTAPSTQETLPAEDLSALWLEHIEGKPKQSLGSNIRVKSKRDAPAKGSPNPSNTWNKDGVTIGQEQNGTITTTSSRAPKGSHDKKAASKTDPGTKKASKQDYEPFKDRNETERNAKEIPPNASKPHKATSLQASPEPKKLTSLQTTMQQKLISSRFRHLNESLYTKPSAESLSLFRDNPQFFKEYHDGFRRQVDAWPENPRDTFLAWIRQRGALDIENAGGQVRVQWKFRKQVHQQQQDRRRASDHPASVQVPSDRDILPRDMHNGICTIADLGCGEGQLGLALIETPSKKQVSWSKKLKLYVRSFDLASSSQHVTVADMRALPLDNESVDVAIFCLALMGTNWIEFVEEAYRILRWRGELWISEVGSRFAPSISRKGVVEHSVGNRRKNLPKKKKARAEEDNDPAVPMTVDEEDAQDKPAVDVAAFVDVLRRRGLQLVGAPEVADKAMFVRMRFIKCLPPTKGKGVPQEIRGGLGQSKPVFIDQKPQDAISDEAEAAVLKPCVYKIR